MSKLQSLAEYHKKRRFSNTPEPEGHAPRAKKSKQLHFVIHEHHATRLHFDFRLEADGVLKSWAVPKGPSMNPNDKHLAVMVEDHPLEYGKFEGAIPEGQYGAGEVRIWDSGTYEELGDPLVDQIEQGKITILMHGKKLKGEFHLVRMHGEDEKNWLIFKHRDEYSDEDWQMKPLLNYGSRSQSPKSKKKSDTRARALERLVKRSKKKV